VHHRKIGLRRIPQAEAIVVLAGEDEPRRSGGFYRPCPLFRVDLPQIKVRRGFLAAAPFPAGGSVHAKVDEAVKGPLALEQLGL
jgi:hypothetical protein